MPDATVIRHLNIEATKRATMRQRVLNAQHRCPGCGGSHAPTPSELIATIVADIIGAQTNDQSQAPATH